MEEVTVIENRHTAEDIQVMTEQAQKLLTHKVVPVAEPTGGQSRASYPRVKLRSYFTSSVALSQSLLPSLPHLAPTLSALLSVCLAMVCPFGSISVHCSPCVCGDIHPRRRDVPLSPHIIPLSSPGGRAWRKRRGSAQPPCDPMSKTICASSADHNLRAAPTRLAFPIDIAAHAETSGKRGKPGRPLRRRGGAVRTGEAPSPADIQASRRKRLLKMTRRSIVRSLAAFQRDISKHRQNFTQQGPGN
ncbi:unnamed protein product [Pleuronectes platessa]|uniref:Uncharacterized protein n=1 Tax=Pleuronectes platessa TaxID=8262 RepID=A0A9N7VAW6_PLEPL|nr:unnamed protein product [Pleuronectes platessa]